MASFDFPFAESLNRFCSTQWSETQIYNYRPRTTLDSRGCGCRNAREKRGVSVQGGQPHFLFVALSVCPISLPPSCSMRQSWFFHEVYASKSHFLPCSLIPSLAWRKTHKPPSSPGYVSFIGPYQNYYIDCVCSFGGFTFGPGQLQTSYLLQGKSGNGRLSRRWEGRQSALLICIFLFCCLNWTFPHPEFCVVTTNLHLKSSVCYYCDAWVCPERLGVHIIISAGSEISLKTYPGWS